MTFFEKLMKKYSFDMAYFSLAIITALIYIDDLELIDFCYLCVLTFYYLRIKIHRWCSKYLITL